MNSPRSIVKLEGQMNSEFNEFSIYEIRGKEESTETRIKWFGIRMREIYYFQYQQLFRLKFGENEEHYELICKIKLLNVIKTQITSW